ncbi:MAG: hypothetical protein ACLU8D_11965 [Enterocloster sp.]
MEYNEICGKRQLEFIKQFDYIREAGTDGEEKAALEIQRELKSFGVDSRLEEFEIDTWRILKAEFTVTEPFEKHIQWLIRPLRQHSGGWDRGVPVRGKRR